MSERETRQKRTTNLVKFLGSASVTPRKLDWIDRDGSGLDVVGLANLGGGLLVLNLDCNSLKAKCSCCVRFLDIPTTSSNTTVSDKRTDKGT